MSFNRLKYDKCETKQYLNESVYPGNYFVGTPVVCGNCFQKNPRIIPQRTGVSMNSGVDWRFYAGPIDVESDLKNLNRPASRCPSDKYNQGCGAFNCTCNGQGNYCGSGVTNCNNTGMGQQYLVEGFDGQRNMTKPLRKDGQRCCDNNLVDFPDCYLSTEDTRLSNPPYNLKGVGVNRFQPLCLNPQEQIMFPGEYNVPSRTVFKDNHRPCIPSLETISQPPVPTPSPLPCHKTTPTCSANIRPMFQYDVCG
jgi:hypothetical protein